MRRETVPDYLLDTGVLIRCLRGDKDALSLWASLAATGDLHISAVTYLEIIAGMQPREEVITYDMLASCICHPLDEAGGERAGRLIARYRSQGIALSVPDAAIAATALLASCTLVTYNRKHFPIPELTIYPM
jgi:predicted nucleic acid-binding protein